MTFGGVTMAVAVVMVALDVSDGVELCRIFNTCRPRDGGRQAGQFSSAPGPPPAHRVVDGIWLEPTTFQSDFVYHLGRESPPTNWYNAARYCRQRGGYLAEPQSPQEHDFLSGHARQHGDNWWIGLRKTESCRCSSGSRASSGSFMASLSPTIVDNPGLARTVCPDGFRKSCSDGSSGSWRWFFSGLQVLGGNTATSNWNTESNEPNGGQGENCVTLWSRADFRWADWSCSTTSDLGHQFKPLCQRDKDIDIAEDEDDEEENQDFTGDGKEVRQPKTDDRQDNDGEAVGQITTCVDENAVYRTRQRGRLTTLEGVGSHLECQRQCALNQDCRIWTWRGDQTRRRTCVLARSTVRVNFRRPQPQAFAGKMDAGCREQVDVSRVPGSSRLSTRRPGDDYCVEYGVRYAGLVGLETRKEIEVADDCRQSCQDKNGCSFWSWQPNKRCFLQAEGSYELKRRKNAVTGSVLNNCRSKPLSDVQKCDCLNMEEVKMTDDDVDEFEDDFDDAEYLDLVGEGLVDLRSFGVEQSILATCRGKGLFQRCWPGQKQAPNEDLTVDDPDKGAYCGDFDIQYAGEVVQRYSNVPSADVCRARCIQHGQCLYWSWKGTSRRKRCSLFGRDTDLTVFVRAGSISGSLIGACSNLALSQLKTCRCTNLSDDEEGTDGSDDSDDDDDYMDLTSIVDLRNNFGNGNVCKADEGRRCTAENADPMVRTRGFFGDPQE